MYDVQVSFGFPDPVEAMLMAAATDAAMLFPNSIHAIAGLAQAAQERWIAYASGELTLPSGHNMRRWSGAYAESIVITKERATAGEFVCFRVTATDPKAAWLEYGTSPWDMKQLLSRSHKVRRGRRGRYLIIPFRHGTPGTLVVGAYSGREMPVLVHTWWLARDRSWVTGSYQEPSVLDPNVSVTRLTYRWGDRLTARDVEALGLDPEHPPGKHLVGMVKMGHPDNNRHNQYLTFRTMSERSPPWSWQHPGTPALAPGEAVYQWVLQQSTELLEAAMEADIERIRQRAGQGRSGA